MTPREWWRLTVELEEEIPSWEWIGDSTIGVSGDRVWIRIDATSGSWVVEVADVVHVGGYYDQAELRFSHRFESSDAEDVVSHIRSII